ncbi:MAG: amino acid adenylation domain-containing protein [Eubacteriales bacterium]|nr:amino acid adenylation domain-containing protein [Eubacteriales bacterium]
MINVLEYLDHTAADYPQKTAFADENTALTFGELHDGARAIGSFLCGHGIYKKPVVVFMPKSPQTILAFLGVISAGCFYVPIDEEMPAQRITLIFEQLQPEAVICDSASKDSIKEYGFSGEKLLYDEMTGTPADEDALAYVRKNAIDTDPVYVVFTSGSTGIPKGVVACHRSVIDYIEVLTEVLRIDGDTVFGLQVPLYVDACLKEVYATLKFGATTWMIPKQLFMFPVRLVEFMNRHRINTVCWVVSALTIISGLGAFKKAVPEHLRTIAFGSEVFPIRQFNLWKQYVPGARYINLYGPTEATGMSCWFEVDRDFALDEPIPIGQPFKNTDIFLLDENDRPVTNGGQGEICIRGTSLAMGYYSAFEKTGQVFVQNPLNKSYPELIYRTGDIARYNERKELVFISRKDNQIKHMGQRIELGEIEIAANAVNAVSGACCIFDNEKKKIVLFYTGDMDEALVSQALRDRLPRYMMPNLIFKRQSMPYTSNGKLDRIALKQQYAAQSKSK